MIKIYLDSCCYNRPFDPPSNPTIIFESSAKLWIQGLIVNGSLLLTNSYVIFEEINVIADEQKRALILEFLKNAKIYVASDRNSEVLTLATEIMQTGIKYMDASHVACAIIGGCDYFITADKRLLKYQTDRINVINPIDFIRTWEDVDGNA